MADAGPEQMTEAIRFLPGNDQSSSSSLRNWFTQWLSQCQKLLANRKVLMAKSCSQRPNFDVFGVDGLGSAFEGFQLSQMSRVKFQSPR